MNIIKVITNFFSNKPKIRDLERLEDTKYTYETLLDKDTILQGQKYINGVKVETLTKENLKKIYQAIIELDDALGYYQTVVAFYTPKEMDFCWWDINGKTDEFGEFREKVENSKKILEEAIGIQNEDNNIL